MASEAVTLEAVGKQFADTRALTDVSMTVEEGEFFTLVGPSGCGKTTTLRLLGGFESPTAGSIRFDGEDVAGVPPERRDVGVVFQNYALFPHMTVRENVAYGLNFTEPPGGRTVDGRVEELLALVDLAGMADRDPDELSGGQRQRVAMARALAPGPSLLLLDEPMSALDARLRERLRVQVREIQRELGITTIYVTHDQEEALAVSDRVAVMHDGRIEQIGRPREIYHRPATRFVAEFVGDNNVFSGRVQDVRGTDDGPVAEIAVDESGDDDLTATTATIVRVALDAQSAVTEGDRLTFCVRPEDVVLGAGTNRLDTVVESAEFLGATTRVHLDWQGTDLLARTRKELDGDVAVGFDPADAHVVTVE